MSLSNVFCDEHSTMHVVTSLPFYRADGDGLPDKSSPYLGFPLPLLDLEEISFYTTILPSISSKNPVVEMERERTEIG